MGSTFAARLAGSSPASPATVSITSVTTPIVAGSVGSSPNNKLSMRRVVALESDDQGETWKELWRLES